MVDPSPATTNWARAARIVMQATGCGPRCRGGAGADRSGRQLAILVTKRGLPVDEARAALARNNGFLRLAVNEASR